jgi:hypothetical protein
MHNILFLGGDTSFLPDPDTFNHGTIREMQQRTLPGPFYIKVKNTNLEPVGLPQGSEGSGVYQLTETGTLVWSRPGLSTLDADFDRGEVLLANLPLPGSARSHKREVCTVEGVARNTHVFAGPHELTPTGEKLLVAVRNNLGIAA